jgi:hypothetical protein
MLGAKTPERVYDKIKECHFFVARMADYEQSADAPEHFLYCVSAFLSAFRTVAYRLYGVTKTQRGKAAQVALRDHLHAHSQIGFLLSKSNVEIHEDGVRVWQRYKLNIGDSMQWRGSSRWNRNNDRWSSQVEGRYPVQTIVTVKDWQFEGNQSNLIILCCDALAGMENFVQVEVGPSRCASRFRAIFPWLSSEAISQKNLG